MYAHAKVSVFENAEKLSLVDQKFETKSRDLVEEKHDGEPTVRDELP